MSSQLKVGKQNLRMSTMPMTVRSESLQFHNQVLTDDLRTTTTHTQRIYADPFGTTIIPRVIAKKWFENQYVRHSRTR